MIEINWTPLPLFRSSRQSADYFRLLSDVENWLDDHSRADSPAEQHLALNLLARLAQLMETNLLRGDTFALESELVQLASFPGAPPGILVFAGTSRTRLHLLRYSLASDVPGRLEQWTTPLEGTPVGLSLQPVGYLNAHEVVALSTRNAEIRELRLDVSDWKRVAVMERSQPQNIPLTATGRSIADKPSTFQIEVRRTTAESGRPSYHLRVRMSAVDRWRPVHTAHHPLQCPVDDGSTLYFVAQFNQIMAIRDPLHPDDRGPRTVISLETPSPIQTVLRLPTGDGMTLLAGTADGTLFAINPESNRPLWKYDPGHSMSAATFLFGTESYTLAIGTPDGLLSIYHPVDTNRIWNLVSEIFTRLPMSLERMLEHSMLEGKGDLSGEPQETPLKLLGPRRDDGAPRATAYLRLLVADRLLHTRNLDRERLEAIRNALVQTHVSTRSADSASQTLVIRFLGLEFQHILEGHVQRGQCTDRAALEHDPRLRMLFSVLTSIAQDVHGDARRKLERLLRRLRTEWLDPRLFERYRDENADALSHQSLSSYGYRHEVQVELRAANAAASWDEQAQHLLRALTATWKQHVSPLNRTTSLQGVTHAVPIFKHAPHDSIADSEGREHSENASGDDAVGSQDCVRLAGLVREGIQVFRLHPDQELPESTAFFPLSGGHLLTAAPLDTANREVVAVATSSRISLFTFELADDRTTIRPVPAAEVELDEPATVLKLLRIPASDPAQLDVLALALGQSDGHLRLFKLEGAGVAALSERVVLYHRETLLDIYRPSPIHQVAVHRWPEETALILSADTFLYICHHVHVENGQIDWELETLELESSATAFTIAWPPPRHGISRRPLLVVGMANGLVKAFQPPKALGCEPELCWIYQSPQGVTNIAYLPGPSDGWFVAAADDGALHLIRNGELHHLVTVERYPLELTPLTFPDNPLVHLLVSSPAGAVTLLENTGLDPTAETDPLIERLTSITSEQNLLHWLERSHEPTHRALAAYILRTHPMSALLDFAEKHRYEAESDKSVARSILASLLFRMGEEPENRIRAYRYLREVLSSPKAPTDVKVHLLHSLGQLLDRIEEHEIELLMSPLKLADAKLARAYLKMIEHLWFRFHDLVDTDLVWWRGLFRLETSTDPFVRRRHLLPLIGAFARKLLDFDRNNVLEAIRRLRSLEDRGVFLSELTCEALSLPHMIGDPVAQRVIRQYAGLLSASSVPELRRALVERRQMFCELADQLPGATEAARMLDDILETFNYNDCDQYSRFLVDAPEFLPELRVNPSDHATLLRAFADVRAKLATAVPPAATEKNGTSQVHDRVQVLIAHSEALLSYRDRWETEGTLEQRIVATVVNRWRQNILRPEIRRLQNTIQLSLEDVRVILPEEKGLAHVSARILNRGGQPLEGLTVGLRPETQAPYIWEGSPEWCQGPINYGQAIEYRTEVLLDEHIGSVALRFEMRPPERSGEPDQSIVVTAPIEREERLVSAALDGKWRQEAPIMFEALRNTLMHASPSTLMVALSEEGHTRDSLVQALAASLTDDTDSKRRFLLTIDLTSFLEGPPRSSHEALPTWWLPHRLARAFFDQKVLSVLPGRADLRADPDATLEHLLFQVTDNIGELWFVFRRVPRAFLSRSGPTLEVAKQWLFRTLAHPSNKIKGLLAADFATASKLALPPSPLANLVQISDVDRPYPLESPKSRAEFLQRVRLALKEARVSPSDAITRRLVANAGWHLPILRKLIDRLEPHRADAWLNWQSNESSGHGEPLELGNFLERSLSAISRPFKEWLRILPFFHRLALVTVASARTRVSRRELKPGMVFATEVMTQVRSRANRAKRLYAAQAVVSERDVHYLKQTVGELQGRLRVGLFVAPDYNIALSHLLNVANTDALVADLYKLQRLQRWDLQHDLAYGVSLPLFRRWLVATHPFEVGEEANLRRRLMEDGNVAESIGLPGFVEMHRRLKPKGQLYDFLVFLGLLEPGKQRAHPDLESGLPRWDRLLSLARKAVAWYERPNPENFKALVREWASHLSTRTRPFETEVDSSIQSVTIDLSPLRIPLLKQSVVFGLTEPLSAFHAQRMREVLRQAEMDSPEEDGDPGSGNMGFTLSVPGAATGVRNAASPAHFHVEQPIRDMLGERLIPLSEKELIRTALSANERRGFLDLLARCGYRFQHLSPYHLVGPLKGRAMNALFVGRESEIDDVVRHPAKQFAIVGSRRIGKTTLLLKLKREISAHLGDKARVLYLDCAKLAPGQVWREIAHALRWQLDPSADTRLEFKRHLEATKRQVVLLLDEIDGVFDTGQPNAEKDAEKLMWDLRSLANTGLLRVIVAGYVKIHERRLDPRSAFHNFTTFVKLGALAPEAARGLVAGPMHSLDIGMASEGLIDLIVERTYRVPWIIQLFCHQLILKLDERMRRSLRIDRRILREDVDGVTVQIEEELYTHFTSPRVMTTREQFMLLTMVESGIHSFKEEDVRVVLEARFGPSIWEVVQYEDLHRSLDNLTLTLALTVHDGAYSFPLDMYPSVIRSRLGDVRPRLERLLEEISRA